MIDDRKETFYPNKEIWVYTDEEATDLLMNLYVTSLEIVESETGPTEIVIKGDVLGDMEDN